MPPTSPPSSSSPAVPDHHEGFVKVVAVYPATEREIKKNDVVETAVIKESPDDYATVTFPLVVQLQSTPTALGWVYNILEKRSETERIIFENPDPVSGFVLLPDLKWNPPVAGSEGESSMSQLYCLAICHNRGLHSIRDLRAEHLPLLKNMRDQGCKAIEDKYGVHRNTLRLYFHYQPSFYHLHVHFTRMGVDGTHGSGWERNHLLDDVIDNIETISGDYYARRTLVYHLNVADVLYKALEARRLSKEAQGQED